MLVEQQETGWINPISWGKILGANASTALAAIPM